MMCHNDGIVALRKSLFRGVKKALWVCRKALMRSQERLSRRADMVCASA